MHDCIAWHDAWCAWLPRKAKVAYLGSNFPATVKGWAEVAATIKQQNAASRAPRQSCMSRDVGSSVRYGFAPAICTCIKVSPKSHRACRGGAPTVRSYTHACTQASGNATSVQTRACGNSTGMPLLMPRTLFDGLKPSMVGP